ncbi:MAG TPA: aldehyde dehydrogenase family protein [Steroidobacteraceae bacterium]|nr:aldehyde dehydrogenase family protein [Steroidobacteraceae bacterium]
MSAVLRTISPVDGSLYAERPCTTDQELDGALARARAAQRAWRSMPLANRAALLRRFCAHFEQHREAMALELSWQIGRPARVAPNEINSTVERARFMIGAAAEALADIEAIDKPGFLRFVRREPLGVVFVVAAWNYPYLITVNSVIPALMAGNAVLLKHSAQTPLCGERFAQSLAAAGLPDGLFQVVHLTHEATAKTLQDPRVDFVFYTGSVAGGHAVQAGLARRFIGAGLELGGCDPVYVRHDADLAHAIENIVDGAYFNSGQSCCGLQRIYVHHRLYDDFVDGFVALTRRYVLGNPLETGTTLGPVVRTSAADEIRARIAACVAAGAQPAIDERHFPASRAGTPYLAPQALLQVDHSMPVMREEIFGPVAGIMAVRSDEAALALMNDSRYGLTAAIWTRDTEAALRLGEGIETGTWFMNRCDYLDPALAWVGIKDSGRGCSLSRVGYEQLTRPKSFHLRVQT